MRNELLVKIVLTITYNNPLLQEQNTTQRRDASVVVRFCLLTSSSSLFSFSPPYLPLSSISPPRKFSSLLSPILFSLRRVLLL